MEGIDESGAYPSLTQIQTTKKAILHVSSLYFLDFHQCFSLFSTPSEQSMSSPHLLLVDLWFLLCHLYTNIFSYQHCQLTS